MLKTCVAAAMIAVCLSQVAHPARAAIRSAVLTGSAVLGGALLQPCTTCAVYRMPRAGETVTLNPQPLPPRTLDRGVRLRR